MVDKTKAIEKIIDDVIENIKDKDVKEIFKTENSFYNTILNSPEFLKEHEKSLRELLPTKYDEMLCRFEKIYPDVNYFENFLKGYITLEKKIVGCSKLSDVEKIEAMSFNYTWDKPTIDWTFFRKGLENGNFTIKDRKKKSEMFGIPFAKNYSLKEVAKTFGRRSAKPFRKPPRPTRSASASSAPC